VRNAEHTEREKAKRRCCARANWWRRWS